MTAGLTASAAFERFFRDYLRRGMGVDPTIAAMPLTYLRELYATDLTYEAIVKPVLLYLGAVELQQQVSELRWNLPMRQCRMLHEGLTNGSGKQSMNSSYRFFTTDYFNAFEGVQSSSIIKFTFRERFIAAAMQQSARDDLSEVAIGLGVLDHVLNDTLVVNLDNPIPEEHQDWLDRLGRLMQLIRENFTTQSEQT